MPNEACTNCSLHIAGECIKWRRRGKCKPSTREWFTPDSCSEQIEFISVENMCEKSSIFGNNFIGLTLEDLERLKNGEVIYLPGEYGTFIGLRTDA